MQKDDLPGLRRLAAMVGLTLAAGACLTLISAVFSERYRAAHSAVLVYQVSMDEFATWAIIALYYLALKFCMAWILWRWYQVKAAARRARRWAFEVAIY